MGKKRRTKRQWLWEFIKRIVVVVTFFYIAAMVYAAGIIWIYPDSTAINVFIEKTTEVFIAVVVSYAIKAGFENCFKIKTNPRRDDSAYDDPIGGYNERDNI